VCLQKNLTLIFWCAGEKYGVRHLLNDVITDDKRREYEGQEKRRDWPEKVKEGQKRVFREEKKWEGKKRAEEGKYGEFVRPVNAESEAEMVDSKLQKLLICCSRWGFDDLVKHRSRKASDLVKHRSRKASDMW
jgi:hypothetical protein